MTHRILFVDDDANLLQGYKRYLRKQFNIETALGGQDGLDLIHQNNEPFAVIISDMRMPKMDGTAFLAQVRAKSPDSVRMLLTGQADMEDAVAVVNEGQIFRFLTKPCAPEILANAIQDGIQQYDLITAERQLLNQTLKGSIKLLADIMSLISPDTFSRSVRLRSLAGKIAKRLNVENLWQVDVAAVLSQIGTVTLPVDLLRKKSSGMDLTINENTAYLKHIEVGHSLVKNIPRLEDVADAMLYQDKRYDGVGLPHDDKKGKAIPHIARILKAVLDYDDLVNAGKTSQHAMEELKGRRHSYDADILAALDAEILQADQGFAIREIRANQIKAGMMLAADLKTKTNLLLVQKRHEISETLRTCILNFAEKGNLVEPIKILEAVTKET